MSQDSDRSRLFRYDVRDFYFDDLADSAARHDITVDGVRVIPRERHMRTALDRFTKASEKASQVPSVRRLDLTERPTSFSSATTAVRDRQVQIGTAASVPASVSSGVSPGLIHLYQQGHFDSTPQKPNDPHHGGRLR